MMGLGYLGSSSSSSSSNLSPLAPPFTVDRSNHNKPIVNSNPASHFNDPSYGVPFSSSWPYSHPSTARQDFLGDSLSTVTAPSNDCMYTIPEPINPPVTRNWSGLNSNVKPGTHWSAVNPSPKPVTDSYSFNVSEAKPFYPPYASPVNNDDIPLVTLSKPGYDLLSTSGLVLGDESSQVDYTRSLSGLDYNPQREGIWSGPPEGKHGQKMESDDSFFSEEANIAASLAYEDYFKQGAYGTETLSKGKEDSSMFYHAADIIRRENNIGPSFNGKADVTSFSVNNHRLNPNEFSKGPVPPFRAFPMFSESHPLVPSPEPPEEPWKTQNSYALYEKRFHLFDSSDDRMSPSMTKSSPSLVIKPPKSMEIGNVAALNINGVVGSHKPLKEKEGLESNGSFLALNQLSFQIGRTDQHSFVTPSSSKEDMSTNLSVNGGLNFEFKARSGFQVPDINIANVKTSAANSFEHFDHHNPAEDSPCWKGAPTSHFLPFEASSPQHPTKKLQTDHSFNHSSKVHEMSESKESIEKEHSGEAQSVHDDTIKPRKEHSFLDESTSDANSQTSQLKLPNFKEDVDHSIRAVEHVSVFSVEDAANLATAKKVNASSLVKALHNLSDLLLVHCSNDEYALKEQDQKALDHVIANLNVCMSRKVQVASTNKLMLPLHDTSNMSQEVTNDATCIFHDNEADYQKLNSDNVEKLMECASLRNEAVPPKDDKMVQAIKKVLDEHLECKEELPSETLLYKNLWLEAEAELCSLSYRARFERMKREAEKGEASESSVPTKKSSSRSGSPFDLKIPPKLIDKADDSQVSNTHVQNHHLLGSLSGTGDVEALVMDRFNILKQRGESNLVTVKGQEVTGKGSGGSVQHDVTKGENVEPLVMARLNILKRRGEPNAVDVEEKRVADGEENESLSGKAVHFLHEANKEEAGWYSGSGSDWEHILKDEFSWQSNGRLS